MAGQNRGKARVRATRETPGAGLVAFESDWEGGRGPWRDQSVVFDEIGEIGYAAPRRRHADPYGWSAYEDAAEGDVTDDADGTGDSPPAAAAGGESVGDDDSGTPSSDSGTSAMDDGSAGNEPQTWRTTEGDVLYLPPAVLNALILRLRRLRLRHGRPRKPGRRPRPGHARRPRQLPRKAVTRRIGQLVRGARRTGAMRSLRTGQRFPVFSIRGRRSTIQMVTRPRGRRFEIQLIRPVVSRLAKPGHTNDGSSSWHSEIGPATVATAAPISHQVPFAPLPAVNAVWPVLTTHPQRLVVSYKQGDGKIVGRDGRRFRAQRVRAGKPARWHAGIDLFAYPGDKVVACEDGRIVGTGFFLTASTGQRTDSLLVQHPADNPRFVINYGEISNGSLEEQGLKVGDRVKAGQVIGRVGDTGMLHFEMYAPGASTTAQWKQTDSGPPATLLDPTKHLLALAENERARTPSPPPVPGVAPAATPGRWDKAVRNNATYARTLGWGRHLPAIARLLEVTVTSPSQPALAEAAARWQAKQGLSVDGIIGPNTWARMQPLLNVPAKSTSSKPVAPAPTPPKPTTTPAISISNAVRLVSGAVQLASNAVQLTQLRSLAGPDTQPTVANALAITRLIAGFHRIPWRVCFTILEHEGGVSKFKHPDGVMQTISSARKEVLPLIPRPLKLAILGLPATDSTPEAQLTTKLHQEFKRRLAVQIAAGIEELRQNLSRFNGYVALAYQAYNVGPGWSYYTVTPDKTKKRPKGIAPADWERMCREGAALLHLRASEVRVSDGVWQCDKNMPGWFLHFAVFDRRSGRQLIGYKYLRSFVGRHHANKPSEACTAATHGSAHRQKGSGNVVNKRTRYGSLDKLYNPGKLGEKYRAAVEAEIGPIVDDGLPLKVVNGALVKVHPDGTTQPI